LKKLACLGGGVGFALVGLFASDGHAADQGTSPRALADTPMADITDVYAWMTGSNLNLVMDVSPADNGTRSFSSAVLYVFHVTSKPGLGLSSTAGVETRVICRLPSDTSVDCWVTDGTATKDYVTGDPSNPAGVTSVLGKVKVFAGRRSDPFFFNATGFTSAVANYTGLAQNPPGPMDPAGCPSWLTAGQASSIRGALLTGGDAFATRNVMALVLQVDRSLVNDGMNRVVGVWGSTHEPG
jgi:hypothetical protein